MATMYFVKVKVHGEPPVWGTLTDDTATFPAGSLDIKTVEVIEAALAMCRARGSVECTYEDWCREVTVYTRKPADWVEPKITERARSKNKMARSKNKMTRQQVKDWAAQRRANQIAHIEEHKEAFAETLGGRTVAEYFAEYGDKWEDPDELYVGVCDDLNIQPKKELTE